MRRERRRLAALRRGRRRHGEQGVGPRAPVRRQDPGHGPRGSTRGAVDNGVSHVRIQRGREQAGGAAPPVHGAQPERRGERRGHQAGKGHRLRSRVQRRGGGRRVAAHLPQGRAGEGV